MNMANAQSEAAAPVLEMPARSGPLSLATAIEQMRLALIDGELEGLLAANERLRMAIERQRREPAAMQPALRAELRLCSELLLRANARNQRAMRVFFEPVDGYGPSGVALTPSRL